MDRKQVILTVDDTETNIEILLELLSETYDVMAALDGESALEIAEEESPDLILLDIMMPEMNGYEVCKKLKENPKTKDIPIIFITAKTDEESIEQAYDVGGVDYVTKPFKPKELLARVKNQIELKMLISHLEFISSHDSMTGILNRRKFFELGKIRFNEDKENLYAVIMDIDKFKSINDTHGHAVGDKVITFLATRIDNIISEESIFGRLGGEEFAILCSYDTLDISKNKVEKIRKMVESEEVLLADGKVIKFTISSGVSKINSNIKTIDDLLQEADDALYKAKGNGRNRVVFRS